MLQHQTSTEQHLVQRVLKGDGRAQEDLYRKYVDAMFHTSMRILGTRHEAQDATQECFVKVFQNIGRYRGESTLGAWIKRIAVNTSINALRTKQRQLEYSTDDLSNSEEPVLEEDNRSMIEPKVIHEAIKELPSGCRAVLNLYAFEGYNHREIASILEITESTSKTQYRRAKSLLRDNLKVKMTENEF